MHNLVWLLTSKNVECIELIQARLTDYLPVWGINSPRWMMIVLVSTFSGSVSISIFVIAFVVCILIVNKTVYTDVTVVPVTSTYTVLLKRKTHSQVMARASHHTSHAQTSSAHVHIRTNIHRRIKNQSASFRCNC